MSTSKPKKAPKKRTAAKTAKPTMTKPKSPEIVSGMVTPRTQVVLERIPEIKSLDTPPSTGVQPGDVVDDPGQPVTDSSQSLSSNAMETATPSPDDLNTEVAWPSVEVAELVDEDTNPELSVKSSRKGGLVIILLLLALIVVLAGYYFFLLG